MFWWLLIAMLCLTGGYGLGMQRGYQQGKDVILNTYQPQGIVLVTKDQECNVVRDIEVTIPRNLIYRASFVTLLELVR
jgi:hypothetical protein